MSISGVSLVFCDFLPNRTVTQYWRSKAMKKIFHGSETKSAKRARFVWMLGHKFVGSCTCSAWNTPHYLINWSNSSSSLWPNQVGEFDGNCRFSETKDHNEKRNTGMKWNNTNQNTNDQITPHTNCPRRSVWCIQRSISVKCFWAHSVLIHPL